MIGGMRGRPRQQPWERSPDVLRRIAQVVEYRSKRLRNPEIAQVLGISLRQVGIDLARARELYKRQAADNAADLVQASLATYDAIQRAAWARLARIPNDEQPAAAALLLARIESVEYRRTQLLGLGGAAQDGPALTEAQLRDKILSMAIRLGLALAPAPEPGPEDFFDPDGDSGIDLSAQPPAPGSLATLPALPE